MDRAKQRRINVLMDRVLIAAESAENRRRSEARPMIAFAIEEPIAWTVISGLDIGRFFSDAAYYVEQVLRQKLWRWETFPDDGQPLMPSIPAWLGHYPEFTYIGLGVTFDQRGVPNLQEDHPLSQNPDLRHLAAVDVEHGGWMPRVLRWHEQVSAIVGGRLAVPFSMTWFRGCLDLAVQLRGYERLLMDTAERPEFVHALLDRLAELRCRWWAAHARRTGEPPGPTAVADDWINVPFISPELFRDFVLPPYLAIERFHGGIASIHSCGNQAPVQCYLLEIRSLPQFEVSPWTDLGATLINVPANKKLGISLHPNDVLCASEDEMRAKMQGIVHACRGREYSIGTSGLTPLSTDVGAFVRRIRTWTTVAHEIQRAQRS